MTSALLKNKFQISLPYKGLKKLHFRFLFFKKNFYIILCPISIFYLIISNFFLKKKKSYLPSFFSLFHLFFLHSPPIPSSFYNFFVIRAPRLECLAILLCPPFSFLLCLLFLLSLSLSVSSYDLCINVPSTDYLTSTKHLFFKTSFSKNTSLSLFLSFTLSIKFFVSMRLS